MRRHKRLIGGRAGGPRRIASATATLAAAAMIVIVGVFATRAWATEPRRQDSPPGRQQLGDTQPASPTQSELVGSSAVDQQGRLTRLAKYQQQVTLAAGTLHDDPGLCLRILTDPQRCPSEFRDFTWGLLRRAASSQRTILSGHKSPVTALRFSPDGKRLASGSEDGAVGIWGVRGDAGARFLEGHTSRVRDVVFSPDGRILLSSADDGARFWNVESGQLIGTLSDQGFVTFMPDDQRVISFSPAGQDWELRSGPQAIVKYWHVPITAAGPSSIEPVSLSPWESKLDPEVWTGYTSPQLAPDGSVLALLSRHRAVLCDAQTGDTRFFLSSLHVPFCGQFSSDGRLFFLLAVDEGTHLYAWNAVTGEQLWSAYGGFRNKWEDMAVSPNGKTLVLLENGVICMRDVLTGREIRRLGSDAKPAFSGALAYSPDGQLLAAGNDGQGITIFAAEPLSKASLIQHDGDAVRVAGSTVLIPHDISRSHVLDVTSGQECARIEIGRDPPTSSWEPRPIWFSADERSLLLSDEVAYGFDTRKSWRLPVGTPRANFSRGQFSPDGKWFVSSDTGCVAKVWDATTGHFIRDLVGARANVSEIRFSPNGHYVVGSAGDQIVWWHLGDPQGTLIASRESGRELPLFSADSQLLAASAGDDAVIYDAGKGSEVARLAGATASYDAPLAFSADNQVLAIRSGYEHVLWDLKCKQPLCQFRGDRVWFCPDNAHVVTMRVVEVNDKGDESSLELEPAHCQPVRRGELLISYATTPSSPVDGCVILTVRDRRSGAVVSEARQKVDYKLDRLAVADDGSAAALITLFDVETWRLTWNPQPVWREVLQGPFRQESVDLWSHLDRGLAGFSADGKYLTVVRLDGTGEVWNVDSEERQTLLPPAAGTATAVAFSPQARQIAVQQLTNSTEIIDADTGLSRRLLDAPVDRCEISPDGKYVAVAETERVGILRADAPSAIEPHFYPAASPRTTWHGPSGMLLVAEQGQAYALTPGKDERNSLVQDDAILPRPAVLAAENRCAALVGRDNELLVWKFGEGGAALSRTSPITGDLRIVWLSPDGRTVGAVVDLPVYSAPVDPESSTVEVGSMPPDIAASVPVSPQRSELPHASSDQEDSMRRYIGYWDTATGTELAKIDVTYLESELPTIASDGSKILAPCTPTEYGVWSMTNGQPIAKWAVERGEEDRVRCFGFAADGKVVAIGVDRFGRQPGGGTDLVFHDTRDGRALWSVTAESIAWGPCGHRVILGTADGAIHVRDAASGSSELVLAQVERQPVIAVAVTPDGRSLAALDALGLVTLWSLETGLQLDTLHEASQHMADRSILFAEEFAFSPGGERLVLRDVSGRLVVWSQSGNESIDGTE